MYICMNQLIKLIFFSIPGLHEFTGRPYGADRMSFHSILQTGRPYGAVLLINYSLTKTNTYINSLNPVGISADFLRLLRKSAGDKST